jgi:hypothetical protein
MYVGFSFWLCRVRLFLTLSDGSSTKLPVSQDGLQYLQATDKS